MTGENSTELASWNVRAVAWELLAVSFRYPDAQLAEALASGEWEAAAREVVAAAQLAPEQGWDEGLAKYAAETADEQAFQEAAAELMHTLRREATRLLVGAPHPVCSPFEGVWRAQAEGVEALLFVNPHSMAVERFMGECGLGRPEGTNEPLDHISTECELLQYLAALAAGLVEQPEDAPALAELPGGSPEAAYEQFLEEHARVWMPQFASAVDSEAREPFYQAAAKLLGALLSR